MQNNNYLIIIFNVNASTPSQTSNALKIAELKTLCMPVPATVVYLSVSQSIVCINKLNLHIIPVCPNLPLDTALTSEVRILRQSNV